MKGRFIKRLMREERSIGQENEKTRIERAVGGFMVAVMQKCKHFATFAENNDTAGRGRCERFRSSACVCVCVCGGGRSNGTAGSGRRTTEVK